MSRFVQKLASSVVSVALVSAVAVGGPAAPVSASAGESVTDSVTVGQDPRGVAVSPDGTRVYVTNALDDTLSVIDTSTNEVTDTVHVWGTPLFVAVSPDGTAVYVTAWNRGEMSVIDTSTNTVSAVITVGPNPKGVVVHPDGTKVYVANGFSGMGKVSVIETATNTVSHTIMVGDAPQNVMAHPDGTRLYVTNMLSATMSVIDTSTNEVTDTIPVGGWPQGVAVHPDGSKVYVPSLEAGTVTVINTSTNTVSGTIMVGNYPDAVAVHPDGSRLYVTNRCGDTETERDSTMLMVIDTYTNVVFDTFSVDGFIPSDGSQTGIAMNHDGTTLFVAVRDENYETNPSSSGTVKAISVPPQHTSTYSSESTSPPSQWWSCSSPPATSSSPPVVSAEPPGNQNQGRNLARIALIPGPPGIEPMDLSSGLWETFLLVNPPLVRSFYLVGTLLSSALGFSELEVKIFPNPPGLDTLPQWILTEGVEPSPAIVVNGVATILIVLSLIAVFISQRLRRNND